MKSNITIRPVIVPAQRRPDGSYNVKIRVTFQRISRLIATQYFAGPEDVTKTRPPKLRQNTVVWLRASELVRDMYGAVADLNFIVLEYMSIDAVVAHIKEHLDGGVASFRLDFFEYGHRLAEEKKNSTAKTYYVALGALQRFLNRGTLDISEISANMIKEFYAWGLKEIKASTTWEYITVLKTIYFAAKKDYNDEDAGVIRIPKNPFSKLPPKPKFAPAKTAHNIETMQKIISYTGPATFMERRALDIYILGFALMGMNMADMFGSGVLKGDILCYERQKTKDRRPDRAYIEVKVDSRISELVERYRERDCRQAFKFHRLYATPNSMAKLVGLGLDMWCERMGINRFTFYSCRHSWATIARSSACKIDKALVDECLNHTGDLPLADTYIERDWQMLWDANKKVLDLFDWPESWPEPKRTHTVKK